jgi:pSer/pThr/pTyr-binding forkhead associated (FHA) protein
MSDIEQTRVMGAADRTVAAPAGEFGATVQMPAGGEAFRTQMGGTTTCPICKSTTPLMEAYCGDCGFLLASAPAEAVEVPAEETPDAELVDMTSGRRYRLRPGPNTLGRQGTDILIDDGTVSRVHARLTLEYGVVTVEDLGSTNGTKVGDRRIGPNEPIMATHGTPLRFGNWRVLLALSDESAAASAGRTVGLPSEERTLVGVPFTEDGEQDLMENREQGIGNRAKPVPSPQPAAPAPAGMVVAILRKTEGASDDIPIHEGVMTIGRRPNNTVVLPQDTFVSGRHAEIVTDNTGTYIVDLNSTNGTVVNGEKLIPDERQLLLDGDEVRIGRTVYLFALTSEEAMEESGTTDAGVSAENDTEA